MLLLILYADELLKAGEELINLFELDHSPETQKESQESIRAFVQRYGVNHLPMAYLAATPLIIQPELLYQLWTNFAPPETPWTSVSDILLSSLCREVGHEIFQIPSSTRYLLLERWKLKADPAQIADVEDFLLAYAEMQANLNSKIAQYHSKIEIINALAISHPDDAFGELIAFANIEIHQGRNIHSSALNIVSLVKNLQGDLALQRRSILERMPVVIQEEIGLRPRKKEIDQDERPVFAQNTDEKAVPRLHEQPDKVDSTSAELFKPKLISKVNLVLVWWEQVTGDDSGIIANRVAESPILFAANDQAQANLEVRREKGEYYLYDDGNRKLYKGYTSIIDICNKLEFIARYWLVKRLNNDQPSNYPLHIKATLRAHDNATNVIGTNNRGDLVLTYKEEGSKVNRYLIDIFNESEVPIFINLLYLEHNFSINALFPKRGEQRSIQPGSNWTYGLDNADKLLIGLTQNEDYEQDCIKVFATSQPIDLSLLAQNSLNPPVSQIKFKQQSFISPISEFEAWIHTQINGIQPLGFDNESIQEVAWTSININFRVERQKEDFSPKINKQKLRSLISEKFSLDEIAVLCDDLNIDFDGLRGDTKNRKINELILYCINRGITDRLLQALQSMYPNLSADWSQVFEQQHETEESIELNKPIFDLHRLQNLILMHFSLEEINVLCFDLIANSDELHGTTKSERTRELILYCEKQGIATNLIQALQRERPNIDWSQSFEQKNKLQAFIELNKSVFDRQRLHSLILDCFSLNDLRMLCFEMNIEFENLPGNRINQKITELILYCERRSMTTNLIRALQRERPNIDWSQAFEQPKSTREKSELNKLRPNFKQVQNLILKSFSLDELKVLCFNLGVDFDELLGNSIEQKTSELVHYYERRKTADDLLQTLQLERPNINWSQVFEQPNLTQKPSKLSKPNLHHQRLQNLILEHFSLQDIKNLCFDVSIDFEDILGETIGQKAIELIYYCERREITDKLFQKLQDIRPIVDWFQVLEQSIE